MGQRRKLISAVFTAMVIAIAFRILNVHDSADDYLSNGIEENVKEISKIIIENNIKKDLNKYRKNNRKCSIPKSIVGKRKLKIYEDFRKFPYNDMEYSSDAVFEMLKEIYGEIDFYSEFEKGDIQKYDFYKEKFKQFLDNEFMFYDPDIRNWVYFKDYSAKDVSADIHDFETNVFYFFDIDSDTAPELCISNNRNFVCVFDYLPDKEEVVLWYSMTNSYYRLNGTRTVRWDWDGSRNLLVKLDEYGETEMEVDFYWVNDFNRKKNMEEMWYMIGLPLYFVKNEGYMFTDAMMAEAYYDEAVMVYYFRVTEEQFNELTKDYFAAAEQADENIKEVTFTYEELFGDYL